MVKVWQLGLISFDAASKIQNHIARRHLNAMLKPGDTHNAFDTVLLLEHKPIYTIGIRDSAQLDDIEKFKSLGAEFKKTNRGGLITFHGPGQLVVYPVINLKHFTNSVKWYVKSLEDSVISMCSELGIKADRSEHTGVWVDDNKLASIGIHASRYITTHGVAINCDNDLSWFDHIDPCGFSDKGVTSLTNETRLQCTVDNIAPIFMKHFSKVFNTPIEPLEKSVQEDILSSVYTNLLVENTA